MSLPLGHNQMAHTLVIPQPPKKYDNLINMVIGNMHNPIKSSGDAKIM